VSTLVTKEQVILIQLSLIRCNQHQQIVSTNQQLANTDRLIANFTHSQNWYNSFEVDFTWFKCWSDCLSNNCWFARNSTYNSDPSPKVVISQHQQSQTWQPCPSFELLCLPVVTTGSLSYSQLELSKKKNRPQPCCV